MTARDVVVAAVRAAMPADVTVLAYARDTDPSGPVVMVRVDEVRPNAAQPQALRDYTFGVLAVVPQTTPGSADDALDALLEDVLHGLDQADGLTWTTAARAVFEDRLPAYEVTVSVVVNTTTTEE